MRRPVRPRRLAVAAGVAFASVLAALPGVPASGTPSSPAISAAPDTADAGPVIPSSMLDNVHMNQIQTIDTHNSYKRETSALEQRTHDAIRNNPNNDYAVGLGYSHASLGAQLEDQNVRGLELDLWRDPQGGLYGDPLVRREAGLGPLPDPAWRQPGIKVLHMPDADYATTCVLFTECLRQIERWSSDNPTHVPIFVMLELKTSDSFWVSRGGAVAPTWNDEQAMVGIDAEIRSVFDDNQLIRPDDVRRPGLTLDQSVTRFGWPSLRESRGKVMFFFNNVGSSSPYSQHAPNLEGRVIFPNAVPGQPNGAYRGRDEVDVLQPEIQDLVRRGYVVRTRSDISLTTVREGNLGRVQQSLDSGAQVISTDFPTVGMSARYGTDFVARLPGDVPARCNPVNAPRRCDDSLLEARAAHR
jgi:hypothetical protein